MYQPCISQKKDYPMILYIGVGHIRTPIPSSILQKQILDLCLLRGEKQGSSIIGVLHSGWLLCSQLFLAQLGLSVGEPGFQLMTKIPIAGILVIPSMSICHSHLSNPLRKAALSRQSVNTSLIN